jgi:hypothetical protein
MAYRAAGAALFSWKPLAALEAAHPCSPLRDCGQYLTVPGPYYDPNNMGCTSEGRVSHLYGPFTVVTEHAYHLDT